MSFDLTPFGPLIELGSKIIDRVCPDPAQKAAAQLELIRLQQSGELEELKTRMSAILAEAQSADPWTSRARPSFLYVVYVLILTAIPMGFISAFSPDRANRIALGFSAWLNGIPKDLVNLFGVVMLGYIGGRSWEKVKSAAK